MINVQEAKYFFEQVLANKAQNSAFTPTQFNSALEFAFNKLTADYRAKIRAYRLGQNKSFDLCPEELYLSELSATSDVTISTFGLGSLPSDYVESDFYKYNYITQNPLKVVAYPIREVASSEFPQFENSQLNAPTKKHGIVSNYSGTLHFLPKDMGKASLTYWKQVTPFWAYTVVNNQMVYTSGVGLNGTTVQIPLANQCKNDLVWEICKSLGVAIQWAELEAVAQAEAAKA